MIPQAKAVIPIRQQAAGQSMLSQAFQVEFQRPLEMPKDGILSIICIRQDLVVKIKITSFIHICRYCIEKPETIIRAKLIRSRGIFGSGVMIKWLDDGNCTSAGNLPGQHQFQPLAGFLRDGCQHTQNILDRIAKTQSVPFAVIHQAGRAGPGEGNQAVIQPPDIDGMVEFLIRRIHNQPAKPSMPAGF